MNFLVERVTPGKMRDHDGMAVDRALRASLPFIIEVGDSPERRIADYESTCRCQSVFRVTDAGVKRLKRYKMFRAALDGQANPCVCLCMGRTQ